MSGLLSVVVVGFVGLVGFVAEVEVDGKIEGYEAELRAAVVGIDVDDVLMFSGAGLELNFGAAVKGGGAFF